MTTEPIALTTAAEAAAAAQPDPATAPVPGTCGCGGHDDASLPELDARVIPHAIRHATIFGALDSVGPGSGLVLLAPHDPVPLLAQVEQRWPGRFTLEYLERGPVDWRLAFLG